MRGERAFGVDDLKYVAGTTAGFFALITSLRFLSSQQKFDANEFSTAILRPRGENFDIYLREVRPDGKIAVDFTHDPALDFKPDISPDGSRIIFISDRDENYEIYMMDFTNMNLIRITNTSDHEFEPVFSPDGERVVFSRNGSSDKDVYVINLNDSQITQVTNNGDSEFLLRWSDNRSVSFYGCRWQAAGPFPFCDYKSSVEVPQLET